MKVVRGLLKVFKVVYSVCQHPILQGLFFLHLGVLKMVIILMITTSIVNKLDELTCTRDLVQFSRKNLVGYPGIKPVTPCIETHVLIGCISIILLVNNR